MLSRQLKGKKEVHLPRILSTWQRILSLKWNELVLAHFSQFEVKSKKEDEEKQVKVGQKWKNFSQRKNAQNKSSIKEGMPEFSEDSTLSSTSYSKRIKDLPLFIAVEEASYHG